MQIAKSCAENRSPARPLPYREDFRASPAQFLPKSSIKEKRSFRCRSSCCIQTQNPFAMIFNL